MEKQKLIQEIIDSKLIVIIRGVEGDALVNTVDALYKGRVKFCEITFSQSGEPNDEEVGKMISNLVSKFDGKIHIGAGTVLNTKQVDIAKNAGAEYIISPDTNREVIEKTLELGLVSIPGAMTPTEIMQAHRYGCDFVKVFPSDLLTPQYFKTLSSPFPNIRLIAVGGVDMYNIQTYLKFGAVCCGVGSGIISKQLINSNEFAEITDMAKAFNHRIFDK